ncbi:MAG TPA: hypothetical protein VMF65_15100 [Acidimicrobiales bacterium]|nr:hypothetical protein [Acidimicrobiales bacterium]
MRQFGPKPRDLYRREGSRLELTPAGKALAEFARRSRAELSDFLAGLGEAEEPVVLAAGEIAHRYVLGPAVRLLVARGVRLGLLSTDRDGTVAAVRSGRANLGVTLSGSLPAGLGHLDVDHLPSGGGLAERPWLGGETLIKGGRPGERSDEARVTSSVASTRRVVVLAR